MLLNLKIENIAVIEDLYIEFTEGFNVLTGETGAGKSIIIDAINAVLGERTSKELIRTGTNSAKVSATFLSESETVNDLLNEFGIVPEDDGMLIIQRVINADGRNICRINGTPVTVSMLKSVGKELINIHGQHDNQSLLIPSKHITYIDALADDSLLLDEYKSKFNELKSVKKELDALSIDEAEKARKTDLLKFQIEELQQADIIVGEKEQLSGRKLILNNSEKIGKQINEVLEILSGNEDNAGAINLTDNASEKLELSGEFSDKLREIAERVREISYSLNDCADDLRTIFSEIEYNPYELEEIEERLDILYKLSKKYGNTEEEMLSYLENAEIELKNIEFADEHINELNASLELIYKETQALASKLTSVREKTAHEFVKAVEAELSFLDMPSVKLVAKREKTALSVNGADSFEFLISANVGEEPRPLTKIASGGELSRIMLAIKNVLSDKDDIDTLIFDEIDTGVSGRAAQKIALKIKSVSKGRQVICVTHLAQIAAQADNHLHISKEVIDNNTFTKVETLDFESRKKEIARIIGGLEVTELQLKSAEEMLLAAKSQEI